MIEEIVELINDKNHNSTQEQQQYKHIQNYVQRKIKIAKEKWLDKQCKKAEECLKRAKSDLTYLDIKKLFHKKKIQCRNYKEKW